MKPRMKFYNNGKYTGDYSGEVAVNDSLDEYNCYMYVLEQPDLCLFRFCRGPVIYKAFHFINKLHSLV